MMKLSLSTIICLIGSFSLANADNAGIFKLYDLETEQVLTTISPYAIIDLNDYPGVGANPRVTVLYETNDASIESVAFRMIKRTAQNEIKNVYGTACTTGGAPFYIRKRWDGVPGSFNFPIDENIKLSVRPSTSANCDGYDIQENLHFLVINSYEEGSSTTTAPPLMTTTQIP